MIAAGPFVLRGLATRTRLLSPARAVLALLGALLLLRHVAGPAEAWRRSVEVRLHRTSAPMSPELEPARPAHGLEGRAADMDPRLLPP